MAESDTLRIGYEEVGGCREGEKSFKNNKNSSLNKNCDVLNLAKIVYYRYLAF